ncbi:hypothetical protein PI126_g4471 [Phytophthora idaei]|nr:hypothetical protein PI126_g4471 [Phytophthora idaei]
MAARRQQVLNGSTKYKHAFECGKSIADIMSRNVTFVFKDDDERIVEIEEIAKDGVAPFVGREGECVDPISRLPSLEFSPTPGGNTANYDTADIAAKCSDTDASMGRRSNGSDDDNPPPTQRAELQITASPPVPTIDVPAISVVPAATSTCCR